MKDVKAKRKGRPRKKEDRERLSTFRPTYPHEILKMCVHCRRHESLHEEGYCPSQVAMIYALVDPRSGKIRYVGRTVRSLHLTVIRHRAEARSWLRYQKAGITFGCMEKNLWILRLLKNDRGGPAIRLLEQVRVDDEYAERRWFERLKCQGVDLTNQHLPPLS